MITLENKHVDSEKYTSALPLQSFNKLQLMMQYVIWEEMKEIDVLFPSNGYLNILCSPETSNFNYSIDEELLQFKSPQNIIQHVKVGQHLHISGQRRKDQAIIVFIPESSLSNMFPSGTAHTTQVADSSRLSLLKSRVLHIHATAHIAKNLRIQSLLLDALALQLEMLNARNESTIHTVLLEKIVQAQQLIEKDLTKSYTISELAKAVGTNEQYLKKYFKQHLGKTIMHYALEAKMLHAKKLIMSGDFRIADVARMTGYKHATHFSMSFKKFFGILPTSLRYCLLFFQGASVELAEFELLTCIESSNVLSWCIV
ncbi:helix-turn-helix transcriptional regulator [Sphingobacterium bambusae]|uniref:Helix-turn-helix transcriptional regulator n=1 Tax=Sphingobacterium bambusae TaxID=662858 RepID=A0ABW6BKV7_9SPHI|nr:AraC family transcriptional regulator [Sphingobacterium bambusae]WPL50870.1 AraC family transcriptional regulator [Sphingobacterium bambusae]